MAESRKPKAKIEKRNSETLGLLTAPEKRHKKRHGKALKKDAQSSSLAGPTIHPYDTDPADHCETPKAAFKHLAPFLKQLAKSLKKPDSDLFIYDPYYCEGGMKSHLAELGFSNVYNRNEDFYSMIDEDMVPDYDILITSPPYSRNHMQRVAEFCRDSCKPWALVLPSFVHRKQYWQAAFPATCSTTSIVWIVPAERYHYWSICGGRRHNLQVCRHWAREGRCQYGDQCAFLHGLPMGGHISGAQAGPHAPADVTAGTEAQQNVEPHALAPYESLWHVSMPEKSLNAVCQKWQERGASIAKSPETLAKLLRDIRNHPGDGAGPFMPLPNQSAAPVVSDTGKTISEQFKNALDNGNLSVEEALAAERERVRLKKVASRTASERRARAQEARNVEIGNVSHLK